MGESLMGTAAQGQVFSDLEIQATNKLALNNSSRRRRCVVMGAGDNGYGIQIFIRKSGAFRSFDVPIFQFSIGMNTNEEMRWA